jgi:translation initiation factor 2B subunit (eIF-2B alpha/beta/delta family)
LADSYSARNKDAINIEAELKIAMPVYIQFIDQIPEEYISSLITECERALYFNFELIKAIKETIQKRKSIEGGL